MAILMFLQNYKPYNPCCKILGRGGGGHYHILDFLLEKKLNQKHLPVDKSHTVMPKAYMGFLDR